MMSFFTPGSGRMRATSPRTTTISFRTMVFHSPLSKKAIVNTNNSSPGRDGIPFKARRKVADLAAPAFLAAYHEMVAPDGLDRMRSEWATFNESLVVFLPKNATHTLPDGMDVFSPSNLRPLNITNTDNRIFW